jgi:hypothetical protein
VWEHVQLPAGGVEDRAIERRARCGARAVARRPRRHRRRRVRRARERQPRPHQFFEIREVLPQRERGGAGQLQFRRAERVARRGAHGFDVRRVAFEADDDGERGAVGEHGIAHGDGATDHAEHGRLHAWEARPARRVGDVAGLQRVDHRGARLGRGLELEAGFDDQGERAVRAAQQAMRAVAGDVLHDLAARARGDAVAGHEARAEDAIAR